MRDLPAERLPLPLLERMALINRYVGPITSGEVMAAREELVADAFAAWVLANEEAAAVKWVKIDCA